MVCLTYASKAHPDFTLDDLQDILNVSVVKNRELGITGMLVYDGTYFLQYLEGDEDTVKGVFEKIRDDSRHESVIMSGIFPVVKRHFADWAMGCMNSKHAIREVTKEVTGSEKFYPYDLTLQESVELLKRLSFMI